MTTRFNLSDPVFRHIANARISPNNMLNQDVIRPEDCKQARTEIRNWPGYSPTPLVELPGLARELGIEALWYKDEASRFGLKSFKALGGAYAVSRILINAIETECGEKASTQDLLAGRYSGITKNITVSCATDGNHGRSVAWGAQQFGCQCVIYIHATVSEGRKQAIEEFGATVIRTSVNYDDTVRQAAGDARSHGRIVVSDTSYPGYMDIPRHVMQGYTVIADELFEQIEDRAMPTHVFLQGGVGGFAAAISARLWQQIRENRPRIILVEPDRAACIYESVKAGRPVVVEGDLDTIMAGLACGEVSLLAWEVLETGIDDVLVVSDDSAAECMRLLSRGASHDPPLVAGESAVAGLAGLLCALETPAVARAIGLDQESRVLLVGTEGATDENVYRDIVGTGSKQVENR